MKDTLFFVLLVTVDCSVILTFISNIYTCLIYFNSKNRTSRPKLLLGNIALSDIMFIFGFVVPVMTTPAVLEKSAHTSLLIQSLANYLNAFTSYAQSITMTVISYDRYYKIVNGLQINPFDNISAKLLLTIIWSLSLILSLPFLVSFNVYLFDYQLLDMDCVHFNFNVIADADLFRSHIFEICTFGSRFLLQYLLPVLLTAYNYYRCCRKLWHRSEVTPVNRSTIDRRKTIKMLIAVVIVFTVFHFSFYVNILTSILSGTNECAVKADRRDTYLLYAMFIFSSTINPFIYWWLSDSFRQDFKLIIQQMIPFKQLIAFHNYLIFLVCFKIKHKPICTPTQSVVNTNEISMVDVKCEA